MLARPGVMNIGLRHDDGMSHGRRRYDAVTVGSGNFEEIGVAPKARSGAWGSKIGCNGTGVHHEGESCVMGCLDSE